MLENLKKLRRNSQNSKKPFKVLWGIFPRFDDILRGNINILFCIFLQTLYPKFWKQFAPIARKNKKIWSEKRWILYTLTAIVILNKFTTYSIQNGNTAKILWILWSATASCFPVPAPENHESIDLGIRSANDLTWKFDPKIPGKPLN